ncbi:MAG: HAMP domain-containing histidine kinase [Clostridia bacterium]|nr:HAMP domain-containing histidine kinase [Clostridia bacterium]
MIKRLRKKFILISIITVTSVMLLLCVGVNTVNLISVNSKLNKTVEQIIENRGRLPEPAKTEFRETNSARPAMPFDDRRFEKETAFQTRFFVIRYDEDENIIDYNLDKIAAVETDEIDDFVETASERGEGYGYESGYKFKVERQDDGNYMAVFLDCHKEENSVITLAAVSSCVTLFCIVLICVIIVLLSGRAIKPVIENDIKQKQFITDAGHELKTPITVINTCLSVLEMEVGKQKWIDKAAAQTDKLKSLVNSLVSLSKSDEGREPVRIYFNAGGVISETVDSFKDFAERNSHPVKADIESEIDFCGDEYALRQLISILIDNALKYASEGSDIVFTAKKHKKGVLINVSNKCDHIDRDELPKLFDRFYRADKSRNSEKGGFGLGLSIARGICESHRGYIKADCVSDSEIVFTAYLSSLPKKA